MARCERTGLPDYMRVRASVFGNAPRYALSVRVVFVMYTYAQFSTNGSHPCVEHCQDSLHNMAI